MSEVPFFFATSKYSEGNIILNAFFEMPLPRCYILRSLILVNRIHYRSITYDSGLCKVFEYNSSISSDILLLKVYGFDLLDENCVLEDAAKNIGIRNCLATHIPSEWYQYYS